MGWIASVLADGGRGIPSCSALGLVLRKSLVARPYPLIYNLELAHHIPLGAFSALVGSLLSAFEKVSMEDYKENLRKRAFALALLSAGLFLLGFAAQLVLSTG